jgi:phenylpyruvate tautomerase PptA (4-oxalocrotonate tautomerase family)
MDVLGFGEESVSVSMEEVEPQDWAENLPKETPTQTRKLDS